MVDYSADLSRKRKKWNNVRDRVGTRSSRQVANLGLEILKENEARAREEEARCPALSVYTSNADMDETYDAIFGNGFDF